MYIATDSNASADDVFEEYLVNDLENENDLLSYSSLDLSKMDIVQHIELVESLLLSITILIALMVGILFSLAFKAFE